VSDIFQIPDQVVGTHVLKYSGFIEEFGRFEFDGGQISVRQSGYKSYVQTDKPIYKPGQQVRWAAEWHHEKSQSTVSIKFMKKFNSMFQLLFNVESQYSILIFDMFAIKLDYS
jgi:hypothetical protein